MSKEPRPQSELLELQGAPLGEPTRFCPADDAISAFFDGQAPAQQRDAIARHLSDCRYCRGRIGLISRLRETDEEFPVAEEIKARAKQLGFRHKSTWRRASAWAAAAVVLLVAGMWMGQMFQPAPAPGNPEYRELRAVDAFAAQPRIVEPVTDAVIDPADFNVRWTPISGSLHYEFYLLSAEGDLVVHQRTNETWWSPGEALALQPEGEYYLRIEAHLEDATTLSSEHVLVKVASQEGQ